LTKVVDALDTNTFTGINMENTTTIGQLYLKNPSMIQIVNTYIKVKNVQKKKYLYHTY